jgi:D-aminopeptidase
VQPGRIGEGGRAQEVEGQIAPRRPPRAAEAPVELPRRQQVERAREHDHVRVDVELRRIRDEIPRDNRAVGEAPPPRRAHEPRLRLQADVPARHAAATAQMREKVAAAAAGVEDAAAGHRTVACKRVEADFLCFGVVPQERLRASLPARVGAEVRRQIGRMLARLAPSERRRAVLHQPMVVTRRVLSVGAALALLSSPTTPTSSHAAESRPRARDLGLAPGVLEPGPHNAITDVPGVRVGHATIVEGESVRTGITAIVPHPGNLFQDKVAAAVHVFNAFGKLVGAAQVLELGQLETPILLTNTLSVWDAAAALASWMIQLPGNEQVRSINPVVGETNDGFLNDIRGRHVKAEHVHSALRAASDGPVAEGSVGAGTGTVAFGWKGGIGTSSRRLPERRGGFNLGVLVQSNFGGSLTIDGVPVWRELKPPGAVGGAGDGSCMIVVATDAPLDARQLRRLAARAIHGMARVGASGSSGSGDFVIAFSTTRRVAGASGPPSAVAAVTEEGLSPLFQAVIEATEEALVNSLLKATTVRGVLGRTIEAIPVDAVREVLRKYSR